jgi:homoserine dehydrogenase
VTARRLDLAFLGFGQVARAFVRHLANRAEWLKDVGISPGIVGAATRRLGWVIDAGGLDPSDLLTRSESGRGFGPALTDGPTFIHDLQSALGSALDEGRVVLVESTLLNIGDGRPAIDHVRDGLSAGAHVITVNKAPAAFAYEELAALAQARDRAFLFEGAVMDGVPVLNLVRETLPGVRITGFRGVINSTTNYMLTEMERGRSFDEALTEMQRRGIAEADPALDVDGWDAAAKTAVLANVWLGARMTPHDVARRGIRGLTTGDVEAARSRGRRLRLIAAASRTGEVVSARVGPEELSEDDPLAQLDGQQNALVIATDVLGRLSITELDAGIEQTAYALFSDLTSVAVRVRRTPGSPPSALRDRTL